MALRKRPKPEDRDKWIEEAATSDKPQQREEEETKTIQDIRLRIPTDLLEEIDQSVAKRKPKISRHNWILEALHEKVKREKKKL